VCAGVEEECLSPPFWVLCRFDHDIKGQGIYAYVTLHEGNNFSEEIRKDLVRTVRDQIGAFAAPDVIHWAPG
jgi:acetyl-CoA synthetase